MISCRYLRPCAANLRFVASRHTRVGVGSELVSPVHGEGAYGSVTAARTARCLDQSQGIMAAVVMRIG